MQKKILITDNVHQILIEGLESSGFGVTYRPKMSYTEVKSAVSEYDGLVINSKVICDKQFIDKALHLDFIGRLGSGLDIIDLPYAKEMGIEIISSPEGNAHAVGEHALGMLLGVLNNINNAHQDVRAFNWNREPNRGTEIREKTIGIIGFGHTGPAFAKKLAGLHVHILVHDKYRNDIKDHFTHVEVVELEQLLRKSDVVSIHLPLTAETENLVDKDFLNRMKQGAILINTSRGRIAISKDINSALNCGQLSAACLDVLENEKPMTWTVEEKKIYSELLSKKNVIITPHVAGWTHQSLKLIAAILLRKICIFYQL